MSDIVSGTATPYVSPKLNSSITPIIPHLDDSSINLQRKISIFKIIHSESIQPNQSPANGLAIGENSPSLNLHPATPSNKVVLNVFDENKKQKLVEVYTEEVKEQRITNFTVNTAATNSNASSSSNINVSAPIILTLPNSNNSDENQIGRIK